MQVLARYPVVVKAGERVELKGLGFKNTLALALFDASGVAITQSLPVKVENATAASFRVPETAQPGIYQLSASQDGQSQTLSLVFTADMLDEAIFARDAKNVCAGQKFYDLDGNVREGNKLCEAKTSSTSTSTNSDRSVTPPECSRDGEVACLATVDVPAVVKQGLQNKVIAGTTVAGIDGAVKLPANCSSDGETGCLAVTNFPAVDKINKLTTSNIKSGISIANVIGNVTPAPANCTTDGAFNCVVDGTTYIAAKISQFSNSDIKSGITIAGVAGSIANCDSDGATSCIAVDAYPAIDKTGLADKVLSTTSVAGVTGNVTLPAVGKVFSNISYGVGGTSLVGSMTLPLSSNVVIGTQTYGDPDAPLTPSYNTNFPTLIARPGTPSITGSNFNFNPDRITLTWSVATGATGYIVLMRSGSAVSWTPSDFTTYATGTYGSDTMIYSGSGNTVTYTTPITAGFTYYFAVYAYETNKVYSATATTKMVLSCAGLVGGTWVDVPGDSVYGTDGFCVQKYIPSNLNSVPVSQSGTSPWLSISQATAKSTCAGLGSGYHLITNPEWMTIAANIANTPSNWSNGQVGSGTLSRGHSDSDPNTVCPANADDNLAWVANDCTGQTQGTNAFNQRRTQNLSNGSVIWDFGGNAQQFIDYFNADDKPTPGGGLWHEFTVINPSTTTPRSHLVPIKNVQPWWDDSWNSAQSIGKIYPVNQDSGGALTRGGTKSDGAAAGLFAFSLYLNDVQAPGAPVANSFRCAWRP